MRTRVKICGITNLEDALAAVESGADALGFMFFAKSSRRMTAEKAREIIRELPPYVSRVGVFVNESAEEIRRVARVAGLDTLQLHGEETGDFCAQFEMPTVKAIRVKEASSLDALADYSSVAAFLLDAYVAGAHGGTGEKFNWDLAIKARGHGKPIVLAGGLTPENVAGAVEQTRPYGVDVSSGVESEPGRKSAEKIRRFVAAVKGW